MDTIIRFSNHDYFISNKIQSAFTSNLHYYFLLLFSLLVISGCQAEVVNGLTSHPGPDDVRESLKGQEGLESCVVDICRRVRKQRPVCGSDGKTYPSKCHLRAMERCRGSGSGSAAASKPVIRISNKSCSEETKCQAERRTALFDRSIYSSTDLYVPSCSPHDGTFLPLQCHNATGYCWCVTRQGRPLPGTSVHFSTEHLICPESSLGAAHGSDEGESLGSLHQHQHLIHGSKDWSVRSKKETTSKRRRDGTKKRRATPGSCNSLERVQFSKSLIELFDKEFIRSHPVQSTSKSTHRSAEVATWKFKELDIDRDGRLRRKELRNLRRMSIKLVKPRPCAQTFQIYCDVNNDKRIELSEWTNCLANHTAEDLKTVSDDSLTNQESPISHIAPGGRDKQNKSRLGRISPNILKANGKAGGGAKTSPSDELKDLNRGMKKGGKKNKVNGGGKIGGADAITEEENPTGSFLTLISKEGGASSAGSTNQRADITSGHTHNRPNYPLIVEPSTKRSSCMEERKKALELDRSSPRSGMFVPECDPDGSFRKAQCHNSTGYCWCVDVTTGFPIPGISSRYQLPDCSQIRHRQFKGCAYPAKKKFLTSLLDRMTQQMVEHINNNTGTVPNVPAANRNHKSVLGEPDPEQSIEERAVRWKLATLDSNGNQVLERKELRELRQELKKLTGGGGTNAEDGERTTNGEREEGEGRKCRRNFLKYCDENNDGDIDMREWIDCTGLNEKQNNLPESQRRRGRNPFSSVLKSN